MQETQFCPVPVSLCADHVVAHPHLYILRYIEHGHALPDGISRRTYRIL